MFWKVSYDPSFGRRTLKELLLMSGTQQFNNFNSSYKHIVKINITYFQ